ncbi:hypothetical protein AVEN_184529-1 [Araneus ventricosus]|uniref:Histone-lysine N-methyltransferase SETMAR n=1 Tax=Araneus ventricosus TaxID=182803 RepID=A0A4Y2JLE2_ARAVE|nr:hypothetical protein AVEN_184529-1 [Araneus ventricosus]
MHGGRLRMSLTITSSTADLSLPVRPELSKVGLWKTTNADVSCLNLRRLGRAILSSGIALIHDNARPHSAVVTQHLLKQFKWSMSDHQAYSPDLATSDFHLFPELKNWLAGQSF